MSTRIRLARGGRKNLPFYRVVVANSTSPRDGKFLEKIGTYNPLLQGDHKDRITINKERAEYWLKNGATPSERVALFLNQVGVKGAEKYKADFEPRKSGHGAKKKAQELAAKLIEEEAKKKEEAEKEANALNEKTEAEPKVQDSQTEEKA